MRNMKIFKTMLVAISGALVASALIGIGTNVKAEEPQAEPSTYEETYLELLEDESTHAPDLFSQIPSDYIFSSGAGGWGTSLTVYQDGSFEGEFSDSDMGDDGEGYDSTHYSSVFTGKFVNPVKIDDNVYAFEMESISYENPVGTEEIVLWNDGQTRVREIYTDAYGLAEGKTFYLYAPGIQVSELPVGCIDWMYGVGNTLNEDKTTLASYGIYNTDEEYAFFSNPGQEFPQGAEEDAQNKNIEAIEIEQEASEQSMDSETTGHRYEVVLQNGTWEDAYFACRDKGGHLVRIDSEEEYSQIIDELDALGYRGYRLYIGGRRELDDDKYYWADDDNVLVGSPINDPDAWCAGNWMSGEPSFRDDSANADEHVMEMFYYAEEDRWVWNDIPNNLPGYVGDAELYGGFICEYEN